MKKRLAAGAGVLGAAITILYNFTPPHEGVRYDGYRDPIGIPTAGIGHTGPDVVLGQVYSREQVMAWFADDLIAHAQVVDRCAGGIERLRHPKIAASWVDHAFNNGPGKKGVKDGFCVLKNGREPTHLRRIKAGDLAGACAMHPQWANPPLPGLKKRAMARYRMCMEGVYELSVHT